MSDVVDAGPHSKVRVHEGKDVNGRFMVTCELCNVTAHAFTIKEATRDLSRCKCFPNCDNCKNLRHSHDKKPAVPLGGSCNDVLHVCPNDGIRWWQSNSHFHLWQVVISDDEWQSLQSVKK